MFQDGGTFPAKMRAAVQLPVVMAVYNGDLDTVEETLAAGVNAFLVEEDVGGSEGLYGAVCALKDFVRGRAAIYVSDRADVAGAAGVEGLILGAQALPTVVARRTMQAAAEEGGSVLVGRRVSSEEDGLRAEKEGADLILFSTD
eukprot:gene30035-37497_t